MFNFLKKAMASITINGKTFEGRKLRVDQEEGDVFIDGKKVLTGQTGVLRVEVTGTLDLLDCNTATVNGDILGDVTCNTIVCKNVAGDIETNTITCEQVGGNIDANTVHCGNVYGDVEGLTVNIKS